MGIDMSFDMEWFLDTNAWVIGGALWLIFMAMIWVVPSIGSSWDNYEGLRIIITILSLPTCYGMAKWRLDR